ncbi:MAG: chorismate mutase, partial [Acidimicrobiia bacterium]|nr:chorismate mutase [Acidimicrobiia bacterium]
MGDHAGRLGQGSTDLAGDRPDGRGHERDRCLGVDADQPEQITERTVALLEEMFERNGVDHDDLISIWFTVTEDL